MGQANMRLDHKKTRATYSSLARFTIWFLRTELRICLATIGPTDCRRFPHSESENYFHIVRITPMTMP